MENYHYLGLIISLAGMAKNTSITQMNNDGTMQRKTYYRIKSNDGEIDFKLNLLKLDKRQAPYKAELYKLANYICRKEIPEFKKTEIKNDDELFEDVAQLQHAWQYFNNIILGSITYLSEAEQYCKYLFSPIKQLIEWKEELEQNFIPLCRELTAINVAGTLCANIFTDRCQRATPDDIKNNIRVALRYSSYNDKQIDEMFNSTANLPANESIPNFE